MKKVAKKILRYFLWTLASVIGLAVIFLFFAILLTLIPANGEAKEGEEGVTIFLASNGLHVDFVLPTEHPIKDWTTSFSTKDYAPAPRPYIVIGRGDRGFYLETATWADLKIANVFKALFWPTGTIFHTVYLRGRPIQSNFVKPLILTEDQYRNLVLYIEESIVLNAQNQATLLPGYSYSGVNDQFYESSGTYHLFMTCNDWVNVGLKRIGVKTATWAPLDRCVLYHRE